MARIVQLPSDVAQKIAAGEVVERPASVVKELIENSLDAGASNITVELAEGGKRLIRITDDGCGMSREDARICFQRHSTSKLRSADDLDRISTLGFRGEALPSISSVSRVILKTTAGPGEEGTRVKREADRELEVTTIAFPVGTQIEVEDLFFNLPARRKFLRSERAELSRITRIVTQVALAYPEVGFSLRSGSRSLFRYPAVAGLKERLYQVYGRSLLDRLIAVDCSEGEWRFSGYVSRPPQGRANKSRQLVFVNRRPVREQVVLAALNQAFQGFLERNQYPEAFLFLECPYAEVDVNVHPAKNEIRYHDSQPVFRLVRMGLEQALLKELGVKTVSPGHRTAGMPDQVREPAPPSLFKQRPPLPGQSKPLFAESVSGETAPPRVLGQYLDLYIVAVDESGILVIDQHNAHERVLFEKYQEIDRLRDWPRRLPLLPQVMDLSPTQELQWENHRELLENSGFRLEPMGGRSYALREFPDIFKEAAALEVLLSLLEEVDREKVTERKHKLLATMACKTAIKAGDPLSAEKMNVLVENLFRTSNPSLCPHGRPVILRVDRHTIDKEIGRR